MNASNCRAMASRLIQPLPYYFGVGVAPMAYFVFCGHAPRNCYFLPQRDKIPDTSDLRKERLVLAHGEGTAHHGEGGMELKS